MLLCVLVVVSVTRTRHTPNLLPSPALIRLSRREACLKCCMYNSIRNKTIISNDMRRSLAKWWPI